MVIFIVNAGNEIFLSQEFVSNQDRVLLVGAETEDVSVQLFWDAVFGRAK